MGAAIAKIFFKSGNDPIRTDHKSVNDIKVKLADQE